MGRRHRAALWHQVSRWPQRPAVWDAEHQSGEGQGGMAGEDDPRACLSGERDGESRGVVGSAEFEDAGN